MDLCRVETELLQIHTDLLAHFGVEHAFQDPHLSVAFSDPFRWKWNVRSIELDGQHADVLLHVPFVHLAFVSKFVERRVARPRSAPYTVQRKIVWREAILFLGLIFSNDCVVLVLYTLPAKMGTSVYWMLVGAKRVLASDADEAEFFCKVCEDVFGRGFRDTGVGDPSFAVVMARQV